MDADENYRVLQDRLAYVIQRLGAEATIADRPGQMSSLEKLAHELTEVAGEIPTPSEADKLWSALEPKPHDQVLGAVLVAKMFNFENKETVVSLAATDDVDWVLQYGILHSALSIMGQHHFTVRDE